MIPPNLTSTRSVPPARKKTGPVRPVLFIVDDEESVRESFRLILQDDHDLVFAKDAKTALQAIKAQTFDLCLLDILLPDGSGLDLLRQIKRKDSSAEVIMVTALQGVETALTAMKGEARDYITKPFKVDELRELIRKVLARRAEHSAKNGPKSGSGGPEALCLLGSSPKVRKFAKEIKAAAQSRKTICLVGEKGSGMEEAAREIHQLSPRRDGPWVVLDVSPRSEKELERELWGDERKGELPEVGKLEFAHRGTLFIQQVEKLPLRLQDKLTQAFLHQRIFRSEKGNRLPLDIRVILSWRVDPARPLAKGALSETLFRSIGRDILTVPALRDRKEDIPLLVRRVIDRTNPHARIPVKSVHADAMGLLTQYPWPGNIQELESCVENMVLFAREATLTLDDVPMDILVQMMGVAISREKVKLSLKEVNRQFERQYIQMILGKTQGYQTRAAKMLGLHRTTLILKLKNLGLESDYRKIVRKRRGK